MLTALADTPSTVADCADPALVERARHGDEAAVRAIIKRHNRRLYRVARAVLRDDAEAEDVVQETYVRAFTGLGSFRGEAGLATWLTRIALNEALGRMRRRRPTVDIEAIDGADRPGGASLIMFPSTPSPPDPETELARAQIRELLQRTVDGLPEPFRLVFVMRDIEEMSTEEAANLLDIKPETVKTRLHRARRLMRSALDRQLSAAFPELFPFDGPRCDRMADRVIGRLRDRGQAGG